ncbi:uncharacterized protein L3040_009318 [Drepanopeziza brunnea f. sp. 'multigermtubi']|uniref:uncharacterized protein n=1 Tax=Drepanopeziza brunnea f. sp. 'multigermtubi' TaxID=698441 RepID=UPI0023A2B081|nr:hypothetical protein L3040_009318 [Drepanopeziza brunnea f. sp. 'multigermtubi']
MILISLNNHFKTDDYLCAITRTAARSVPLSFNIARLCTKAEPQKQDEAIQGACTSPATWDLHRARSSSQGKAGVETCPGEARVTRGIFQESVDMRFSRYIIEKPPGDSFKDEEQADYERNSDYFVTSLTTGTHDHFEHGFPLELALALTASSLRTTPYAILEGDEDSPVGVPEHDTCWKAFKRVCQMRLGEVDLQRFMALWHACYHVLWGRGCC